jgi:hypothetical protein
MQALYNLSQMSSPFALGVFWVGSHIYAWANLDCGPPTYVSLVAEITGAHHHTHLVIGWDGVSKAFLSSAGLELWSSPSLSPK